MLLLAFETSCDDTSVAVFRDEKLLSMETASQIRLHTATGGVVPEVAAREHANNIFNVLETALNQATVTLQEINYIGVTTHPGLIPSLLTGITVATTLARELHIPLIPIHHIEAHIFSNFLDRPEKDVKFPLVCLTVSGGHTEIYHMENMWGFKKVGGTIDDAAGEAYDKVAKMMGLGFPGGPAISHLASQYKENRITHGKSSRNAQKQEVQGKQIFDEGAYGSVSNGGKNEAGRRNSPFFSISGKKPLFPRVWLDKNELNFSFSGLKTAVKYELEKRVENNKNGGLTDEDKTEIAYEFQNAINEVLAYKLILAGEKYQVKTVMFSGGVSANDDLRERIGTLANAKGLHFIHPTKKLYSMDNAAMVGILTYYRVKYGKVE